MSNSLRALVVEDNADLLLLYSKIIESLDFEVDPVATLSNALELVRRRHYDIIVSDMRLGGDQGTDLLRYLQTSKIMGTEVIVVSGEDHYRETCKAMGFDLFLPKPVSMGSLKTLVARLMHQPLPA